MKGVNNNTRAEKSVTPTDLEQKTEDPALKKFNGMSVRENTEIETALPDHSLSSDVQKTTLAEHFDHKSRASAEHIETQSFTTKVPITLDSDIAKQYLDTFIEHFSLKEGLSQHSRFYPPSSYPAEASLVDELRNHKAFDKFPKDKPTFTT